MHMIKEHNTKLATHIRREALNLLCVPLIEGAVLTKTPDMARYNRRKAVAIKVRSMASGIDVDCDPVGSGPCMVISVYNKGRRPR